jgi:NAD(P)-dependent dehydrogenase (short-subunit alcohol dehydrogenase family)
MKIAEAFTVQDYGVVVTGGASGLGLGFAEGLAENGARVTILDLDAQGVAEETERLCGKGLEVRGEVIDVTDHVALDNAIDSAAVGYGRLDVVFANAGIDSGPGFLGSWVGSVRPRQTEGALENYTDARWNRVIDINLSGAFATLRAAARHMKPRKAGRMIVTTSLAALLVEPAIGSAYMAAKAGLAHLTRSIALELAAYNITVNSIAPGFFITNIGGGHAKNPEVQRTLARTIPMHRVGFAEDIKGLALFLASPASAYITGQQIVIDGGWGLGAAD